jgi:hypothetical protein
MKERKYQVLIDFFLQRTEEDVKYSTNYNESLALRYAFPSFYFSVTTF